MSGTASQFPVPTTPLVSQGGQLTQAWLFFFQTLFSRTGGSAGVDLATLETEIAAANSAAHSAQLTANNAVTTANAASAAATAATATANAAQTAATAASAAAATAQGTANDAEMLAMMIVEP